jgi:hypothetical protein
VGEVFVISAVTVPIVPQKTIGISSADKAPLMRSFHADPEGTVDELKQSLLRDIKAGKRISEYAISRSLAGLSKEQLKAIYDYIKFNYDIILNPPPNKMVLTREKNDLAVGNVQDLRPGHIIVLLYSMGKKLPATGNEQTFRHMQYNKIVALLTPGTNDFSPMAERLGRDLYDRSGRFGSVRKCEDDACIDFIEGDDPLKNERLLTKTTLIDKIFAFIRELDGTTVKGPLNKIVLTRRFLGESETDRKDEHIVGQSINLGVYNDENITMTILAHEYGHAIFERMDIKASPTWDKMYSLSLGFQRFNLVAESTVLSTSDKLGHPLDAPTELFASSFSSYTRNPGKLIAIIQDKDTPKEVKDFGLLMFCYMRDEIFKGKVFMKEDPFKNISFNSLKWMLSDEKIDESLVEALKPVYGLRGYKALNIIDEKNIDDERVNEAIRNLISTTTDVKKRDLATSVYSNISWRRYIPGR